MKVLGKVKQKARESGIGSWQVMFGFALTPLLAYQALILSVLVALLGMVVVNMIVLPTINNQGQDSIQNPKAKIQNRHSRSGAE